MVDGGAKLGVERFHELGRTTRRDVGFCAALRCLFPLGCCILPRPQASGVEEEDTEEMMVNELKELIKDNFDAKKVRTPAPAKGFGKANRERTRYQHCDF